MTIEQIIKSRVRSLRWSRVLCAIFGHKQQVIHWTDRKANLVITEEKLSCDRCFIPGSMVDFFTSKGCSGWLDAVYVKGGR